MDFFLRQKELELITTWAISRNSSQTKNNLFILNELQDVCGVGEIAPNIRYGETLEGVQKNFQDFQNKAIDCTQVPQIYKILEGSNFLNCFKAAVVQSLIPLEQFKSCDKKIQTSISIPIMEKSELESFARKVNLHQFKYVKIKTGKTKALEQTQNVLGLLTSKQMLRIDANEAFDDHVEFLKFTEGLALDRIEFFEQPFHADNEGEFRSLMKQVIGHHIPLKIILDESVTHNMPNEKYLSQCHGLNFKISKSGGLSNAISQIKQAKELGLEVMLGCMIESSLGIAQCLLINENIDYYDLDGHLLVSNDPFSLLKLDKGQIFVDRGFSDLRPSV